MSRISALRALWDRALAVGLVLIGTVVLLVGWKQVSDTPFPAEQLPYMISAGIGGLALIGLAATVWLSADLRDEWRELHNIESRLDELCEIVRDAERGAPPLSNGADAQPRRRIKAGSGSSERKTLGAKR
jgi:hypothetical protein